MGSKVDDVETTYQTLREYAKKANQVEGKKNDTGKPRLSLVHSSLLRACARALEHGLTKYGVEPNNWKKVPDARTRYLDAFLRHAHNLADGVEVDPDSGLLELDCLAANLMFLCYFNELESDE